MSELSNKFPELKIEAGRLETAKKTYEDAIEIKAMEDKFGFRVREMRDGEKPTNYFCNLMKNNSAQKYIPMLVDESKGATNHRQKLRRESENSIGTCITTKMKH